MKYSQCVHALTQATATYVQGARNFREDEVQPLPARADANTSNICAERKNNFLVSRGANETYKLPP